MGNLERTNAPSRQSDLSESENRGTQGQETLPSHNDVLLQIKEYACVGFKQVHAGSPEEFERLWARAFDELFDELLDLQSDFEFPD